MKKIIFFLAVLTGLCSPVLGQESEASHSTSTWNFSAANNFYFIPQDFFMLPVFKGDKEKLHVEGRYNYEDRQTFSGWVGYNISGGNKVEYTFTPMIGGVAGLSNGLAPGLEMTISYKNFELYSESEYMFDMDANENNFYYQWTDITYSPKDWLYVGISGQRTRLYQTNLDIQRGLLVGTSLKNWELTTYLYNLGFDEPFGLLTLSFSF